VPRPTSCVTLATGQPDIDAHPAGTRYCVPAGAHPWSLRPKSGDTFTGQPGAALDGGGRIVHAFSGGATNVTIESLEIRGYVPSSQNGMIQPDVRASGWVLRNLNVHDSLHVGIKASDGMRITGGRVWRNGMLGIAGTSANDVTIDGVEIDGNNSRNLSHGFEAGGVKWVGDRIVIRNSFIHHNRGPGLWADINGDHTLIEGNRVEDNENEGIFFEISNYAVIRNNVVNRNGLIKHEWLWGGGITIASSGYAEIYGNTLSGNGNGITGTQQDRPDSGGNHLLRDMYVHDNTVSGPGRSDVVADNGDNLAIRNIRFVNNADLAGHQGRTG
jgi:parallel beta-helix repeat protein